jgi:hypothetical protein
MRIEWSIGAESGVVQADIAPHAKGTIGIHPKTADLDGKILSLKFFRNDYLVDEYKLPIGKVADSAPPARKGTGQAALTQTGDTITVRGRGFEWQISRQSGQILKATRKGQPVLVGGPALMVLPTKDYDMTPGFPDPRPQSFEVFNTLCSEWKATSVSATQSGDAVEIYVSGQYKEAAGNYTIRIAGDGQATVSYHFKYTAAEKISARQVGMVFYAPRSCDTLSWKRKSQWSVYPDDHVGRPEGITRALPDPSIVAKAGKWMEVAYRQKPTWPWFKDANEMGTRDFRATRSNIFRATLKNPSGNGITVRSGATHHTRSFLDGDRIGLLVAYFSGPAMNTYWLHGINEIAGIEPLPVQAGTVLEDVIHLSLEGA